MAQNPGGAMQIARQLGFQVIHAISGRTLAEAEWMRPGCGN
jgi:hypothetical protein